MNEHVNPNAATRAAQAEAAAAVNDATRDAREAAGTPGASHVDQAKTNFREASDHIKQAAMLAGESARHVAEAAKTEFAAGREKVGGELNDAARSGRGAVDEVREAAGEQIEYAIDRGTQLMESAQEFVREKPMAAFGIAFASGWVLSRLLRR